jgi:hypothetical protein
MPTSPSGSKRHRKGTFRQYCRHSNNQPTTLPQSTFLRGEPAQVTINILAVIVLLLVLKQTFGS